MSLSEISRSHHSSSTSISSSRSDHSTDYHEQRSSFSQEAHGDGDDDNNDDYENHPRGGNRLFNSGGSRSFSSTSMTSQRGRGGDSNEEGNNTRTREGGPRYALERPKFKPIIRERCENYVKVTPVRNYPIK